MESLTPRSNVAIGDEVGLRSDLFSSVVALGSTLSSGWRTSGIRSGVVEVPTLPEGAIRSSNRNANVRLPSGSPLRGVEGEDEQE